MIFKSEAVKIMASVVQVNNAGVNAGPNGSDLSYENAEAMIATNYYGVKNVTEGLLPLLRASPARARIVNVSSRLGLYNVSNSITRDLLNPSYVAWKEIELRNCKHSIEIASCNS